MDSNDLATKALAYEESVPQDQHNWDEGGGWRDLTESYCEGYKQALRDVQEHINNSKLDCKDYGAGSKERDECFNYGLDSALHPFDELLYP